MRFRQELRDHTTVHFVPYAPGELFIAAQTPEARGAMDISVELSDWGMSARQRRRLARGLTPVLADLFAVPQADWDGVNIRFHPYRPSEFAVGGRLLSEAGTADRPAHATVGALSLSGSARIGRLSKSEPILVTGATGNVGREVVRELRAVGAPVRAATTT